MATPRRFSVRHRAYAGVLTVAVGALAYDQLRSGGPAPARAATAVPPAAAGGAVAAAEVGGEARAAASPTAGLAGRLRAAGGGADPLVGLRDAFALPASWAAERPAVAAADAAADAAVADAFAAGHKLSVVLLSAGGPGGSAVIGGRLVRVGQAVDGYRLTAVRPRSARLRGPGGDVDLRMP